MWESKQKKKFSFFFALSVAIRGMPYPMPNPPEVLPYNTARLETHYKIELLSLLTYAILKSVAEKQKYLPRTKENTWQKPKQ